VASSVAFGEMNTNAWSDAGAPIDPYPARHAVRVSPTRTGWALDGTLFPTT
jgi:hypothetical protein